jgi:hypothetical protein
LPGGARCSARYRAADAPSCRSLTALDKKAAHTKIVLAMLRHENHFAGDGEHVRKDNRQLWTAKAIAAQRGVLQLGRDPSLQNTASGALAWACGQGVLALFKGKPGTFYGPVRSRLEREPYERQPSAACSARLTRPCAPQNPAHEPGAAAACAPPAAAAAAGDGGAAVRLPSCGARAWQSRLRRLIRSRARMQAAAAPEEQAQQQGRAGAAAAPAPPRTKVRTSVCGRRLLALPLTRAASRQQPRAARKRKAFVPLPEPEEEAEAPAPLPAVSASLSPVLFDRDAAAEALRGLSQRGCSVLQRVGVARSPEKADAKARSLRKKGRHV